jgi:hypothetical protein
MTAVAFRDVDRPAVFDLLAQLRTDLDRGPGVTLHWVNIKSHSQRLLSHGLFDKHRL